MGKGKGKDAGFVVGLSHLALTLGYNPSPKLAS